MNQLSIGLKSHFDQIAQRIANLGGALQAPIETASADRQASMALIEFRDEKAYASALLAHYAAMAKSTQTAVEEAEDNGDPDTTDLLMHLLRTLEQSIQALAAQL